MEWFYPQNAYGNHGSLIFFLKLQDWYNKIGTWLLSLHKHLEI